MKRVVITGWARTPFGRFLGSLSEVPATELGAISIRAAIEKSKISAAEIDYVIMGMVVQAGAGQIPSRQATLKAGLPVEVPSDTINKVCASGLRAVNQAAMMIQNGEAEIVVAGGMENMSLTPHLLEKGRTGYRMGHTAMLDAMIKDGLWCPVFNVHMGMHGGKVPSSYGVSREDADRWSLRSHQRAVAAMQKGLFREEICPVEITTKKGYEIIDTDELPRADSTLEKLRSLPPAFEKDGPVTAGNAPPISDGAGVLVVMSEEKAVKKGIPILAEIISWGVASESPERIATVPESAGRRALQRADLTLNDLDLIEVNEAFAAVALTCIRLGNWREDIVNVNGGAVALGHPIGASGARILMTLVAELRRRNGKFGMAAICSGAAQGEATIIRAR